MREGITPYERAQPCLVWKVREATFDRAWLAYCEAVEGANPQTPPKTKRTRDDFICPVHKTPMDGPRTVKNGLPQNIGRQFYKCPLGAECGLKGFRWADGSAPFSEQSVRRAELHHGVPVGSIGVGIVGGAPG